MKNGKRSHRWRLWHARRKYYRDPLYTLIRINETTLEHLRHSPECLYDVIFTDSPLTRLLKTNGPLQHGTEIHQDITARIGATTV